MASGRLVDPGPHRGHNRVLQVHSSTGTTEDWGLVRRGDGGTYTVRSPPPPTHPSGCSEEYVSVPVKDSASRV